MNKLSNFGDNSIIKWLGIFPLVIYFFLTSIWNIPVETKNYILSFVILIGLVSIFLRRKELDEKGKHPFLIITIGLAVTIVIFYFQLK